MSFCAAETKIPPAPDEHAVNEVMLASRTLAGGLHQTTLSIPSIHCGGCVQRIERALSELPAVEAARVNLSTKRATVSWRGTTPPPFIQTLKAIGFEAHLQDVGAETKDESLTEMIRALAVAGFAASNIMLLSVSVWSGAAAETRDLFHWISAAIALPTLAYSGRIFFRSAWNSIRHGHTNMDVPISIGVLMAFGLSVYETINRGAHAYFDASITLLFFLLIGRTLDYAMRDRTRVAVKGLARLAARGAYVMQADGSERYAPMQQILPGMKLRLAAGDRVPVDATVLAGSSDLDCSLVSGESTPLRAAEGDAIRAGTLNLTGPLTVVVTAAAKDSFLADMIRMMEAAESGRSAYRRIADRASQLYAPVVHLTALVTFAGWFAATGDIHRSITVAIAVLIITCPCALGLAVPLVQVMAARRLFECGIMVKDGGGLERLAEIDTILLDKTGTLTTGEPQLLNPGATSAETLSLAAEIAQHSRHPYSRALAAAGKRNVAHVVLTSIAEHAGNGIEAEASGTTYRLGRPEWALAQFESFPHSAANVVLARDGRLIAAFEFTARMRDGAAAAVDSFRNEVRGVEILSGDRDAPTRRLAETLGIPYRAALTPADKLARIAVLAAEGKKVLMVGDGLNDAPSLAAAHASMAPASAADVGRSAADLVFMRESLLAVPQAITVSRNAQKLVRENLIFAIGYNVIVVPIAIAGLVTPLVAAVAMSASSLMVIINSLRLSAPKQPDGDRILSPADRKLRPAAAGGTR